MNPLLDELDKLKSNYTNILMFEETKLNVSKEFQSVTNMHNLLNYTDILLFE